MTKTKDFPSNYYSVGIRILFSIAYYETNHIHTLPIRIKKARSRKYDSAFEKTFFDEYLSKKGIKMDKNQMHSKMNIYEWN